MSFLPRVPPLFHRRVRYQHPFCCNFVIAGGLDPQQRVENEKQVVLLQEDLELLEEMNDLVERLSCGHAVRLLFLYLHIKTKRCIAFDTIRANRLVRA